MILDETITVRQLVKVYNHYLGEEVKILWVLAKPEGRKYAVKEPGKPVRFTNEPGELVRIKDGAFNTRQKLASILYTLAGEDGEELFGFARHMGQVAKKQTSMVHKLDKEQMLQRVKSITPEIYVEVAE